MLMNRFVLCGMAVIPFAITMASCGAMTGSGQHGQPLSDRDRFVGAWKLAWLEFHDPDGKVQRADCTGMFVFTPDGHASVQVMYRNVASAASEAPTQYTQGGYEATFGRYQVDERTKTFTFSVEGAVVRDLAGKDLTRAYEFSGNLLIVHNTDARRRIAWERR
jgi:hypothetical protein